MHRLLAAIKWDLLRQFRYNIATVALLVTGLYVLILLNLSWARSPELVIFLIFNDPALLGVMFIGSLVLFEKSDRSLQALVTTPLRRWEYLWAKAVSLSLIAWASSLPIVLAGHGWRFDYALFSLAVFLTSLLFIFMGFVIVAPCRSFNEFMMKMGLSLVPVALPFLNLFGWTDTYWWYLIPSQAGILLMQAALGAAITGWEMVYGIVYLVVGTGIAFFLARHSFEKHLVS